MRDSRRAVPKARVYVATIAIHGSLARLDDPRDLHHLTRVLRLKPGDWVKGFDGQGTQYLGRIEQIASDHLVLQLTKSRRGEADPLSITLAQALIKGDRFAWVVQKATELGVERIVPLITQRTVVRPAAGESQGRQSRWLRIAKEAAAQSGRARLPRVDTPEPFESFVTSFRHADLLLLPTLAVPTVPIRQVIGRTPSPRAVTVLIGPEGDFTPEEAALAQAHGAQAVSLGRLTLRSETAALATLAILQHAVG